jgi:hypothetical protein
MAIQVGQPAKKSNRNVKPKMLNVISHCSICKEPVTADKNDKASRHGFKRYKKRKSSKEYYEFSQEDDKACAGSGREVFYKRFKK